MVFLFALCTICSALTTSTLTHDPYQLHNGLQTISAIKLHTLSTRASISRSVLNEKHDAMCHAVAPPRMSCRTVSLIISPDASGCAISFRWRLMVLSEPRYIYLPTIMHAHQQTSASPIDSYLVPLSDSARRMLFKILFRRCPTGDWSLLSQSR